MSDILVPYQKYRVQLRVANSRFIASIGPAPAVGEAKDFIHTVKKEYSDATHNVPLYQIGSGSSMITHCSDDGEPSGTAGRPALSVLTGSDLADTVMVITRYFGGTKLGTGGLVKAYSESAKAAINGVKKAQKIPVHQIQLTTPYNLYQILTKKTFPNLGFPVYIEKEVFTDLVEMIISFPSDRTEKLRSTIIEVSSGKISPVIIEQDLYKYIPL